MTNTAKAITRLAAARRAMDAACNELERHPYDPENWLRAQMCSDELDSAAAVAAEWDVPQAPPLTVRTGRH